MSQGAWAVDPSVMPASSSGAPCQPTLPVGEQTLSLDVGATPREVIVHIPALPAGVRSPAVIAFHGLTGTASAFEAVIGLSVLADQAGFVVAYPQGLGSPSNWHFSGHGRDRSDLAMTEALMDLLVEQACVDPDRIVLAGHSMGGGMASDAACRLADRVAGAVLIAAVWARLPCRPVRPVPVIATHALDDPVLRYMGGHFGGDGPDALDTLPVEDALAAWAANDGCSSPPMISEIGDGSATLTWPGCAAPVVLHRLATGGHDWPGIASGLVAELVTSLR